MSILKNEIPILEFDSDKTAVINPDHEGLNLRLPEKCVFAFLGDYIDTYAQKRLRNQNDRPGPGRMQKAGHHQGLAGKGTPTLHNHMQQLKIGILKEVLKQHLF